MDPKYPTGFCAFTMHCHSTLHSLIETELPEALRRAHGDSCTCNPTKATVRELVPKVMHLLAGPVDTICEAMHPACKQLGCSTERAAGGRNGRCAQLPPPRYRPDGSLNVEFDGWLSSRPEIAAMCRRMCDAPAVALSNRAALERHLVARVREVQVDLRRWVSSDKRVSDAASHIACQFAWTGHDHVLAEDLQTNLPPLPGFNRLAGLLLTHLAGSMEFALRLCRPCVLVRSGDPGMGGALRLRQTMAYLDGDSDRARLAAWKLPSDCFGLSAAAQESFKPRWVPLRGPRSELGVWILRQPTFESIQILEYIRTLPLCRTLFPKFGMREGPRTGLDGVGSETRTLRVPDRFEPVVQEASDFDREDDKPGDGPFSERSHARELVSVAINGAARDRSNWFGRMVSALTNHTVPEDLATINELVRTAGTKQECVRFAGWAAEALACTQEPDRHAALSIEFERNQTLFVGAFTLALGSISRNGASFVRELKQWFLREHPARPALSAEFGLFVVSVFGHLSRTNFGA